MITTVYHFAVSSKLTLMLTMNNFDIKNFLIYGNTVPLLLVEEVPSPIALPEAAFSALGGTEEIKGGYR